MAVQTYGKKFEDLNGLQQQQIREDETYKQLDAKARSLTNNTSDLDVQLSDYYKEKLELLKNIGLL